MIVKFLYIVVFMLLSVFSFPNTVFAAQGSIELTLEDSQHASSKENVVFALTKLADINNGHFETRKGIGIDTIDFNTMKHASDMQKMMDDIQDEVSIDQTYHTNAQGYFKADGLDVGLYFIQCTNANGYDQVQSMMVALPTFDEQTSIMNMHVKVAPKHTPNKKLIIKKIDGQTKQPLLSSETTFALYQDEACTKEVQHVSTNKDSAQAVFEHLPNQTYYLKEVKAANGYQVLKHVFKVEVMQEELKIDGASIPLHGHAYEFTIENTKKEQVPTMDQSHRKMYFFLLVAMLPCLYIGYRKVKA